MSAENQGEASFLFESMAPGVYSLWAKVSGKDNRSNEFYFSIDNPYSMDDAELLEFKPSEDFYWIRLDRELVVEQEYETHRVSFGGKEKYAKLDKIILTNDGNAVFKALNPPVINELSYGYEGVKVCFEAEGEGIEGFSIERKIGEDAFEEIGRLPAGEKEYIDNRVSPYEDVSYRVKSYSQYDSSPYSAVSYLNYGLPTEPVSFTVLREQINRFKLNWEYAGENVSGYIIERRVNNGEYEEIARVDAYTREYTDRINSKIVNKALEDDYDDDDDKHGFWRWVSLIRKFGVYYRIRAYNSTGYSKYVYPLSEEDLIEGLQFSNGKSDRYITREVEENEYLYQDIKNRQSRFVFLPDYLNGTDFLRSFYNDSNLDDREYLSFKARKNIRVYLAVERGSDVNDSEWSLKQEGVAINTHYYPDGVDIYYRIVRKGKVFSISGNRSFTHTGNIFL
ncbi:hypothetical protein ES705_44429 [subsurface metagenome]